MGPDFFGNSCSNTLRSNCSQLKWPLMRQNNKTTNQCYYSEMSEYPTGIHKNSHDTEHFLLKPPHFSFPVPFCFPPTSLPLSSLFSLPLQQREKLQKRLVTLVTLHGLLSNWATSLSNSPSFCLSLNPPPPHLTHSLFDHWAVRAEASALPRHMKQIYTSQN